MAGGYRKYKRLVRYSGHLARVALFLCTIAALLTFFTWTTRVDLVERADDRARAIYPSSYNGRLAEAKKLLAAGKTDEAEKSLRSLATSLSDVDKQETLGAVYASTLMSLYTVAEGRGDFGPAEKYARALLDFNSNDFEYWIKYAYALDRSGKGEESLKALRRAYAIAPQSLRAATALATVLFNRGQKAEARAVVRGYISANRATQSYAFFAHGGEDCSPVRAGGATEVITGERQTFRMPVQSSGVEKFRIDFHGIVDMDLKVFSFTFFTPEGDVVVGADSLALNTFGLRHTGELTYELTERGDLRIGFAVPASLKDRLIKAVAIDAAFTRRIPPELNFILGSS